MRLNHVPSRQVRGGYAILIVMLFVGVGIIAVASVLQWSSTNAGLNERNNLHYRAIAAAEAATEKVLTHVNSDYKNFGEITVNQRLSAYRNLVPTEAENPTWGDFEFTDAQGTAARTHVVRQNKGSYVPLQSEYQGLMGFVSDYRIVSNARDLKGRYAVTGAVQQDVQLAVIPIFQYAIFYNGDMEFIGTATLTARGRVHGNANLYTGSANPLTFSSDVTVVGSIFHGSKYGYSSSGAVNYGGLRDTNASTLMLPVGTNSAAGVRQILLEPPPGEPVNSGIGMERFYNKAELVILINNTSNSLSVKRSLSPLSASLPAGQLTNFLSTTTTFTDQREGKTVKTTQFDVGKFSAWASTNTTIATVFGSNTVPNIVYIADKRTTLATEIAGVRLVNGQTLPDRGLTIATPNPLYTKGHYNQPDAGFLGSTNTSNTKPASFVCDAYTLLSGSFSDSLSAGSYSSRVASDTTVNAALLTGNVPSANIVAGTGTYSGGVNNLLRLLEHWSGKSYTINGSMICLFPSAVATQPFQFPGVYYSAPTRNINFDLNFTEVEKLPPGTPGLRAVIRGRWTTPPPNTINYAGL